MKKESEGYTLIELLVTLSIIAIIADIAITSFDGTLDKNKHHAVLTSFLSELHLARSEAIKRSHQIVICPSNNGITCDAISSSGVNSWAVGRIIFVDNNRNNIRDPQEEIIRVAEPLAQGLTIKASADVSQIIRYRANGMTMETGELTICDPRGSNAAQAIIINTTGRPQISKYSETGGSLTCN